MRQIFFIAAAIMVAFTASPKTALADAFDDIDNAALMAQLAPACGVRPETWQAQVALGSEAAVQAERPNTGMFPSADALSQVQNDETVVDGALADGKYLFNDYGNAACKAFLSPESLREADGIAANAPLSGHPGGWVSEGEAQAAWNASRADIAFACRLRSKAWLGTATTASLKALLNAASTSPQPLDDTQKAQAIAAANKLLIFDRDIAAREILKSRKSACDAVKNSTGLAAADNAVKSWNANPDPWAGAGGN